MGRAACTHLQKAGFSLSGPIARAIFLSTLTSDPNDSKSWHQHVKAVKFDPTMTLVSVIEDVLNASRRTPGGSSKEQTQESLPS
ncbi:hypothetical protein B0H14DRAFT_3439941 [Mycena olivaceomarginata]|nr:hypothetical protein B0H14DRAFT_3439941 [Mycena olivaceomarginata]